MIILTSNGLSSGALIREARKFIPEHGKAVIITTASLGYKEKDWHLPRLTSELESLGLSVDTFDFDFQEAQLLESYNVAEILGGNPFHLLKHLHIEENKRVISTIAEEKVLIGISAGTLVLQKDIKLVAQFEPEMNAKIGLKDLSGLALTQFEILPHYQRFISQYEGLEERIHHYEQVNNCTITRLDDGEGIFIADDRFYQV